MDISGVILHPNLSHAICSILPQKTGLILILVIEVDLREWPEEVLISDGDRYEEGIWDRKSRMQVPHTFKSSDDNSAWFFWKTFPCS